MNKQKGFTLIELMIVVMIIGLIAAISIPGITYALNKSKQKTTMGQLRNLSVLFEQYNIETSSYPSANSMKQAEALFKSYKIADSINYTDSWGNDFLVYSSKDEYIICSGGRDGGYCLDDKAMSKEDLINVDASIVITVNGYFLQAPL